MRIDDIMREKLAGLIDHGDFATGANSGIDSQNRELSGGRRKQNVLEVIAKYLDGFGIGILLQLQARFALNRGIEQALPGVLDGQCKMRRPIALLFVNFTRYLAGRTQGIQIDGEIED